MTGCVPSPPPSVGLFIYRTRGSGQRWLECSSRFTVLPGEDPPAHSAQGVELQQTPMTDERITELKEDSRTTCPGYELLVR